VTSFTTITQAVAGVAAGSYAEQVNIFTPLTLEGVISGNSGRAVITVPSTGLFSNIDSIFGDPIVAQVMADAAGTVNISNITVDGSENNQNNLVDVVGIIYASGTSGTVNEVTTRGQRGNDRGYGIWAENGHSSLTSVTIENCNVYAEDKAGIFLGSNRTPPTLTATVKGNVIRGFSAPSLLPFAIVDQAAGNVTNNVIADAETGIQAGGAASNSILSYTITAFSAGISVNSFGATVKVNTIAMAPDVGSGIQLFSSKATVESNTITTAQNGIDFRCHTGNIVSGNTISEAFNEILSVPSSQTVTNTYHNVDIIRIGGC
jgi:hypothetical protein